MLKLVNPWVLLAVLLAIGGAFGYGIYTGKGLEQAARAKEISIEERIQQTLAVEVSKIRVTNTTLKQTIQEKTIEVPVYRECRNDPTVQRLLNDILTGKTTKPAGDSVVPAAEPAH